MIDITHMFEDSNNLAVVIAELNHRLDSGRIYLMSVKRSELTAEDALEAFGFSRDGLE